MGPGLMYRKPKSVPATSRNLKVQQPSLNLAAASVLVQQIKNVRVYTHAKAKLILARS